MGYDEIECNRNKDKGKLKDKVIEREKKGPVMNNETPIEKPIEKEESSSKNEVSAAGAT